MFKIILVFLFCTYSLIANAAFDHSHQKFNDILKKYVVFKGPQSFVNYRALKKDLPPLNDYLQTLSQVTKSAFALFSNGQRLAFLINAYNAFTLKIILNHYPVESIKDIGSLFTNTWNIKFFTLLEEKSHLDNIEHNLIRKNFNEPRIHFAVNCASIGCPALQKTAFTAVNLEQQLEAASKNFLNDLKKNNISKEKKTLTLSKIFKWYGNDFVKKFGSVAKFVSAYLSSDPNEQKKIASNTFDISWSDYDWNLNDSK